MYPGPMSVLEMPRGTLDRGGAAQARPNERRFEDRGVAQIWSREESAHTFKPTIDDTMVVAVSRW